MQVLTSWLEPSVGGDFAEPLALDRGDLQLATSRGQAQGAQGSRHGVIMTVEAPETQRSLFSWAEFMAEEPVGRQNRRGKKEAFVAVPCSSGRSAWNKKGRKN